MPALGSEEGSPETRGGPSQGRRDTQRGTRVRAVRRPGAPPRGGAGRGAGLGLRTRERAGHVHGTVSCGAADTREGRRKSVEKVKPMVFVLFSIFV